MTTKEMNALDSKNYMVEHNKRRCEIDKILLPLELATSIVTRSGTIAIVYRGSVSSKNGCYGSINKELEIDSLEIRSRK